MQVFPIFIAGFVFGVVTSVFCVRVAEMIAIAIPWRRAMMSDSSVSVMQIMRMRFQGAPVTFLIDTYISMRHCGSDVTIREIESCYLVRKHHVNENDPDSFVRDVNEYIANHRTEVGG